ncbi:MAG TPA: substrate-binding domain-containing protein [Chthoniobacterales bacterium]
MPNVSFSELSGAFGHAVLLVCCAITLTASDEANGKDVQIVVNLPNMAHTWNAAAAKAATREAQKLGVTLILQDGQGNSAKQSSDLRNALNQGVDGIALGANDARALTPVVNEVLASGVPIVMFDRTVEGAKSELAYFGLDNVSGGAAMAHYVLQRFPAGAKIAFLTGQPGSSPATDRAKGVHATLNSVRDKYPIIFEQTGNWMRAEGFTLTQNMLTGIGRPDAIIASNDDMALGVLSALQQAGVPKGAVVVVGCDGTPEALSKIRDGELAASVEYPLKQVTMAMDALVQNVREKKPVQGELLPAVLIESSNLASAERYSELK